MTDPPLWTILVASVYARADQLADLLTALVPQLEPYAGQVSVLIDQDDCQADIGDKRTRLVRLADADYICFVDDDDMVAPTYVARIMDALEARPDYVGFRVDVTLDGFPQKQAFHSLRHAHWYEDADGYYRDVSHLNPITRRAALRGLPFVNGFGEDASWGRKVRESGLVATEVFVDEALYEYRWSQNGSLFTGGTRSAEQPPVMAHPYVEYLRAA